jgi:hypothetical protein
LIVLARYPRVLEDEGIIRNKLTETAISYAMELIYQKNPAYIYYLLQIPFMHFMQEVSSIVNAANLF